MSPCGKLAKQLCGKSHITGNQHLFLAGKNHLYKKMIASPASFAAKHARAYKANSANEI